MLYYRESDSDSALGFPSDDLAGREAEHTQDCEIPNRPTPTQLRFNGFVQSGINSSQTAQTVKRENVHFYRTKSYKL